MATKSVEMSTIKSNDNNNNNAGTKDAPQETSSKLKKTLSRRQVTSFHIEEGPNPDAPEPKSLQQLMDDLKKVQASPSDSALLKTLVFNLCERYHEITWLSQKTHVTPEGIVGKQTNKISEQMFGEAHIEFDKTIVSIFCLFWVHENDRASFVECQRDPFRLTEKSFADLRNYVFRVCPTSPDVEALVVFTVLNDLGKVEKVVEYVAARTGIEEVDHDKILWMGLKTLPKIFPSYAKLEEKYKKWLLEGLGAQFNFAQLVQGESIPASLTGLKGLSKEALDLFNMHALFDMAGAAGHVNWHGSVVLAEATYNDIFMTIEAIETLKDGASVKQVYDTYLHKRAKSLGFDIRWPTQRALCRICCMLRLHTKAEAEKVIGAYQNLPHDTWVLLRKELNTTGIDDGWAILLYYAPALLLNVNAAKKEELKSPDTLFVEAVEGGMKILAKCFAAAREHIKDRRGNGVFTADIADVANKVKNPKNWIVMDYQVSAIGEDSKIIGKLPEN
mmetsp:Transcript_24901/g.34862  ORF Transcript_24901/g.34862 Transcript_24901/m.34862 type:complete len:503 (+) Transcript_24901:94-1602(+)|eukprot:CAMPEP_0168556650 /NCGR_PEP_ID=MMETSP0413-20121227/8997_1 /TAXON_ID=136452 /ORGANISM="Filamoeba nolandi, Strain NC-AS-23-1" /LENGTH=502 /DNA_ID=CAMNT_0008587613 /DNA_START=59 /DNA_END=1567 /DNA_ORIENTATION=+